MRRRHTPGGPPRDDGARLPAWAAEALRVPKRLYDLGLGFTLGHQFAQLEHRGRRSGHTYRTVLEVIRYDGINREIVVLSGFGERADWLRNVEANGEAVIRVGRVRFLATMRRLPAQEAAAAVAEYERRRWWIVPMVRAVLTRLLGWRYTGTPDERERLVSQLPLVAFAPRAF